jgi:hypothetical protein
VLLCCDSGALAGTALDGLLVFTPPFHRRALIVSKTSPQHFDTRRTHLPPQQSAASRRRQHLAGEPPRQAPLQGIGGWRRSLVCRFGGCVISQSTVDQQSTVFTYLGVAEVERRLLLLVDRGPVGPCHHQRAHQLDVPAHGGPVERGVFALGGIGLDRVVLGWDWVWWMVVRRVCVLCRWLTG